MNESNKTVRILKMLMMLSGSKRYALSELSEKFQMSERNIIRDMNTIEDAGFVLDRRDGYRLPLGQSANKNLTRLLHFSDDEITILYQMLINLEGDTAVIDRLMKKMNAFYDLKAIEELSRKNDLAKVQTLKTAMEQKKQVILKSYESSNSYSIEDRRVEAYSFMQDYQTVWCYDCSSNTCKQFKISRMETVELQNAGWRYEESHKEPFTDIFRFSEEKPKCTIELRLTLKARNALKEEFPRSSDFITAENNKTFYLKTQVANFKGAGRFVMSMLEDIEIIKPLSFKNHIKNRVEKYLNR